MLSDSNAMRIDRRVLLAVSAYAVLGPILQSIRHHTQVSEATVLCTSIIGLALLVIVLAAMWYGSLNGTISIARFGFSRGRGMWLSLGLVILLSLLISRQVPILKWSATIQGFWMTLGAVVEELVWRVYLIRAFSEFLSPRKGHITLAVLLSAVLFAGAHVFTKSASMVFGLFFTSVMLGYLTFFTKSVLVAAYLHVLANTAGEIGFLGGIVTVGAYLAISLSLTSVRHQKVAQEPCALENPVEADHV